jgi:hypothetical protein
MQESPFLDSFFMDVYAVYGGLSGSSLLQGGPSALIKGGLDTGLDTRRLLPIDPNELVNQI